MSSMTTVHQIPTSFFSTERAPSLSETLFDESLRSIATRLLTRKRENENDDIELKLKRHRTRYPYEANLTISRMGEITHLAGITPFDPNFKPLGEVVKEHAYRRVQLFYYQTLFYYREGCVITQGKTIIQHGKSGCSCCSAAHSAILPSLEDDKGLMKQELQLYQNMNSTVELPDFVNAYDCVIESAMRPCALEILNKASLESIHPYEATGIFVAEMNLFFKKSRIETRLKQSLYLKIRQQEQVISLLENQRVKDPDIWTKLYVKAVFELKEIRKQFQTTKQYSVSTGLHKYAYPRADLFINLWSTCPNETAAVKMIENKEQLDTFIKKYPKIPYPQGRDFKTLKKNLANSINSTHPVDLWLADSKQVQTLYNKIKLYLPLLPPLLLDNDYGVDRLLKNSLEVLELECAGTTLPPYNYLSGKVVRGRCFPYNEQELLENKKLLQTDQLEK